MRQRFLFRFGLLPILLFVCLLLFGCILPFHYEIYFGEEPVSSYDLDEWQSLVDEATKAHHQGDYLNGIELAERGLELAQQKFGKEHSVTAASMHNLALGYSDIGRFEEAEHLLLETLRLDTTLLGNEHPNTLNGMNSLALVYKSQGR